MKTLETIIKQEPIYLHNWSDKFDVISDFENICITESEYNATEAPYPNKKVWLERKEQMKKVLEEYEFINILFASYNIGNYEGDAFVLFEQDNKLFEVHNNHCFWYGLKNQWLPEETTIEALKYRLINETFGTNNYSGNEFAKELKEFIGIED